MNAPSLFRGVDTAVFVSALAAKLRDAGLTVGMSAETSCAQALELCSPTDAASMYQVLRPCLISDREDIATFDAVFAAVFDNAGLPIAPWERDTPLGAVRMSGTMLRQSAPTDGFALATERMTIGQRPEVEGERSGMEEEPAETILPELVPSHLVHVADTPFDELTASDVDEIGRWLEAAVQEFPRRPGRRWKRQANEQSIDLRATLRASLATAAEPIRLKTRVPRDRARSVVMVADVSGSMESFARVYLHLMRVLVRRREAEVFTFTTGLHRATVALRHDDAQGAINQLCEEVEDRFGGTRIATSIAELISSPVWSHSVRGATVIIASDGWDTDPPAELVRHMARLQRMAYRVIWVNPRSAAPGFAPETAGMAAALPFVDELLSGHSLLAMRRVIGAISNRR